MAHALDFINAVSKRRAIVFVLSDFQSTGDHAQALSTLRRSMRMLRRRHDLVALHVDDARERDEEMLRLEVEVRPGWAPGRRMRLPNAAVVEVMTPPGKGRGAKG